MRVNMKHSLFLIAACTLLTACSQNLKSESGLYDVTLRHTFKVPVDGAWTHGRGNPYAQQKTGSIYISPLCVTPQVAKEQPELSEELIRHMRGYLTDHMSRMLAESNKANKSSWKLTTSPNGADIRIDLAVVRLTPRKPALNFFSQVGGIFSPIPGVGAVANKLTKGDICIEGTIRDVRTGRLLLAFKDSNRKTVHLLNKDAYSAAGHAEANMNEWAERLAKLCRACAYDKLGDGILRERIEQRSVTDSIADRFR